jgi:hypothetical protein
VFGPADGLSVWVAQVPTLSGLDEAPDVEAVDQLCPIAGGTSSAAHAVSAVVRAIALMLCGRNVLTLTTLAATNAEGDD